MTLVSRCLTAYTHTYTHRYRMHSLCLYYYASSTCCQRLCMLQYSIHVSCCLCCAAICINPLQLNAAPNSSASYALCMSYHHFFNASQTCSRWGPGQLATIVCSNTITNPYIQLGLALLIDRLLAAVALVIAVGKHWKHWQTHGSWVIGLAYTIRGAAASMCPCMLPKMLTVHLTASPEH